MKRAILFAIATLCSLAAMTAQSPVAKPFVIPELTSWESGTGMLAPSGRIVLKNKELKSVATALAADYQEMFGKSLSVQSGKEKAGDIILSLDPKNTPQLGQEGYRLEIDKTVRINAATAQGAFWGTRTLLQLSEQDPNRLLPKGNATDLPEYSVRGLCIDVARKFVPIRYLRQLVKMMAYYKMNTLQIHLNDNGFKQYFENDWNKTQSAFRLECETYPGLTATDGSYSKQEFIELQKLAEANHLEIIPEIDVPAHSLAFAHYKPSLGSKEYGMDHLDLFNPEIYPFFDALFAEYISGKSPVFRGPRVNIGTDEYSNANQEVVEKFREFTDHYLKFVQSHGKKAVCWGALTHAKGTTPVTSEDVTLNMWYNGYADPIEMKKLGYKFISMPDGYLYIVPAAGYYYDYLNCEFLYNSWTPAQVGNVKLEEKDPAVLGGMFAVWNDHIGNGVSTDDLHDRILPALRTVGTKCWTGEKTQLPYATFRDRENSLSEGPGVNEAGRIKQEIAIEKLQPGSVPCDGVEKIGFGYSIRFTIDCQPEEKGTALFLGNDDAAFYLSDPETGRLGFYRDGYLNTFNYTLPASGKAEITIECTNNGTRLLVDGKERDNMKKKTVYSVYPENRLKVQKNAKWNPTVYEMSGRNCMYYLSTLMMPFKSTGHFKSSITDLHITPVK